ncbi:SAC3/GANP/Nin1/mts3/eIF-3 p25 family-domain-containing protein [Syncephalis fuscata]|nr:SAC3/GANP/Nin1/mts3/eIF-3 p25 family-domain-containing protein [Syncephalis fuscata]
MCQQLVDTLFYRKALLLQQQEKKESHIIGEDWKREKRARRFQSDAPNAADIRQDIRRYTEVQAKDVIDWDEYTIVGTSQKLEKRYLRLTSVSKSSGSNYGTSMPVLEKSLAFIRQKWEEKASYAYLCDQLKAVRQDLTVQRIKNEFTVSVYQVHARLALEHGDLGEYNQCQTQLRQLYEYQIVGNEMEFVAYRILYMLHTRNSADIIATLATLSAKQKADPAVRHALDVRSAISMSNYHRLFRLYAEAPNHGRYLMDQFVGRERLNALTIICRAYLPHIDVLYVQKELGFSKLEDFTTFLCKHDLQSCLDIPNHRLDTRKASVEVAICMKKFEKIDIKGQV